MQDRFETMKMKPIAESGNEAQDILMYVYDALQAKGYDPITQLVGYIYSGDPTYITSYNSARSMICRLERDEIKDSALYGHLRFAQLTFLHKCTLLKSGNALDEACKQSRRDRSGRACFISFQMGIAHLRAPFPRRSA